MKAEKETIRKKIVAKFLENTNSSMRLIASQLHLPVSTVRRNIIKFRDQHTIGDKPKSGRPKGPVNKKLEKIVVQLLKNKSLLSVRDLAQKTQTSASMIQRVKKRQGYKSYKKQKIPKQSVEQRKRSILRARRLYYKICIGFEGCMVLDDETYSKMNLKTLPGPQYYTKKIGGDAANEIKTIQVEKYGPKMLIWQAICSCGQRSRPFFTAGTVNSEIYIKEYLQKRLLPFLEEHKLRNVSTIFWPDLASSHYAKDVLNWFQDKNVNFVPKDMNPPNCPQLRPVERYWANIKRILRKDGVAAKSAKHFQARWKIADKKVTDDYVRSLMVHIKGKIREFSREKIT